MPRLHLAYGASIALAALALFSAAALSAVPGSPVIAPSARAVAPTLSEGSQALSTAGPAVISGHRGVTPQGVSVETSPNWGGYAYCPDGCGSASGSAAVEGVTSDWRIPDAVQTAGGGEAVAAWVGIGGFSDDLMQTGFSIDFDAHGALAVSSWWEMLPYGVTSVSLSPTASIAVGDLVSASVEYAGTSGGDQEWTFALHDLTTASSWSGTEICNDECTPSGFGSADWIMESPYDGTIVQLPAYSTFAMLNDTVRTGSGTYALGSLPASDVVEIDQNNPDYFDAYGVVPSDLFTSGSATSFYVQYLLDVRDAESPCCSIHPTSAGPGGETVGSYPVYAPTSISPGGATNLGLELVLYNATSREECADPSGSTVGLAIGMGEQNLTTGLSICLGLSPGAYDYQLSIWYVPAGGTVNGSGALELVNSTWQAGFHATAGFAATFEPDGLPADQSWTVTLLDRAGGSTQLTAAGGSPLTGNLGNGSYTATVVATGGFTALPSSVAFIVLGTGPILPVAFAASGAPLYPVTFQVVGLPSGSVWSVALGGTEAAAAASSLVFGVGDGPYAYSIAGPPGYQLAPSSGSIAVEGGPVEVAVSFGTGQALSFSVNGLPANTAWTVTVGAVTQTTSTGSMTFFLGNGSAPYTIGDIPGWHQSTLPYAGSVDVSGEPISEPVLEFSLVVYPLVLAQSGLPAGTEWGAAIDSPAYETTRLTALTSNLPNGTYAVNLLPIANYSAVESFAVTLDGSGAVVPVNFTLVTYLVTVDETGLVGGSPWSIAIGPFTYSSSNGSLALELPNGTFAFRAFATLAIGTAGSVEVAGASASVIVPFTPLYLLTVRALGLPGDANWSLELIGSDLPSGRAVYASNGSAVLTLELTNGSYTLYPGYAGYANASRTITIEGADLSLNSLFREYFRLTFTESGLGAGASWTITFNGTSETSVVPSWSISVVNGTFPFAIANVSGFTVAPQSGVAVVLGPPAPIAILFVPAPNAPASFPTLEVALVAAGAAVAGGLMIAVLARARHRPGGPRSGGRRSGTSAPARTRTPPRG